MSEDENGRLIELDELEKLVADAETSPELPLVSPIADTNNKMLQITIESPQATTSTDMPCAKCGAPTRRSCPTCHGPICDICASPLDPKYCRNCLDEPGAELHESPLKASDDDGVVHHGRLLTPGPTFGTMCKRICAMTDYELGAHIGYYKDLVKQAELALDFRRVVLGAGRLEQAQRNDAKRRAIRGVKLPKTTLAAKQGSASAAGARPKAGANVAQMLKMIEALQELNKNKTKPTP